MPPHKHKKLKASDLIRNNKLVKHSVAPDGSCWISVILAALGSYKTKVKRGNGSNIKATSDEQILANDIRQHLIPTFGKKIARSPIYVNGDLKKLGAYGGTDHWQVLAPLFDLFIVLWEPLHMKTPHYKFVCVFPDGKIKLQNAFDIQNAIDANKKANFTATIVHAACSNTIDSHYDVYLERKS